MNTKEGSSYGENGFESQIEDVTIIDSTMSVNVDNYHGLNARTILVYLSLNLILAGQILNLVASGALSKEIASVIGGSNNSAWLSTAIAILTSLLGPPVSQAADYWGRKWFIVVLTIFGFIGSMVTSRATTMNMAIAGQVIAGLSFGSQPLLYAVASEILPRRWRPEAQAGLNVTVGVGGIFTLLVGFKLTADIPEGFRKFYYITAGIQAIAAIICALLYNPPLRSLQASLSLNEKFARLDWTGYAFLASSSVLFIVALSWSQNPYTWKDAHILATFIIGVVLLISLALHQWKFKRDGMFHHDLFKNDRNFAIALFSLFVEGAAFFVGTSNILMNSQSLRRRKAANSFFIFEISILYEKDTFMAGVRFAITFITGIISAPLVALYCSKAKKLRIPTTLAFISLFIFNILMATTTLSNTTATWAYPIFLGFGLGVCLTCLVTAAQLSAPPALITTSSGLLISIRSLGGSVGLAIYNAIFHSQLSSLGQNIATAVVPLGLPPAYLPDFIGAVTNNDPAALMEIPGVTPKMIGAGVDALKESYLQAFRYVWVAAGSISAVAVISALFLVNPRKEMNMHVDAPLKENEN